MHLNTVSIRNYRCFEQLDISLHEHLTLFVGKNGAGKNIMHNLYAQKIYYWIFCKYQLHFKIKEALQF